MNDLRVGDLVKVCPQNTTYSHWAEVTATVEEPEKELGVQSVVPVGVLQAIGRTTPSLTTRLAYRVRIKSSTTERGPRIGDVYIVPADWLELHPHPMTLEDE